MMRDLVPWSLIYGEQNKQHDSEIKKLKDELKHISRAIVRRFLLCCIVDLKNRNSDVWSDWKLVKKHLTIQDLNIVESDLLKELVFPSHAYDIRLKANLLEKDLDSGGT
jgi:hypothetical protein